MNKISLRERYREINEDKTIFNYPISFLHAIVNRSFYPQKEIEKIPYDELFHEAVVAYWYSYNEWEDKKEGFTIQPSTFFWKKIRRHIIKYIAAIHHEKEIPLSWLCGDEEMQVYLENKIFATPDTILHHHEFHSLLAFVMKRYKSHLERTGGKNSIMLEKLVARGFQILLLRSCDYGLAEIAAELDLPLYKITNFLKGLPEILRKDPIFLKKAEEDPYLAYFLKGGRRKRIEPAEPSKAKIEHLQKARERRDALRGEKVYEDFDSMSIKDIMKEFRVSHYTARQIKKRGYAFRSHHKN